MAHADKVIHIKGAAHFDTVLKDHEWVVVDFYAECVPTDQLTRPGARHRALLRDCAPVARVLTRTSHAFVRLVQLVWSVPPRGPRDQRALEREPGHHVRQGPNSRSTRGRMASLSAGPRGGCRRKGGGSKRVRDSPSLAGALARSQVDVDSNEELAGRFRISGIPAFHIFHNRKAIGSVTGLDFDKIKHILDSNGKALTSASEGEGRRGKGGRARGGGGEGGR